MPERWPQATWINDGHRADVFVLGPGEEPEVEVCFNHPRDCPHHDEYGGLALVHDCPLEQESGSAGLWYPGDGQKGAYTFMNWDDGIPEAAWMAFWSARDGMDVPIEYTYRSDYDSYWMEWDWSFTWRPVELARLSGRR